MREVNHRLPVTSTITDGALSIMVDMSTVGDRLRAERIAAGLTLEQAGTLAGVSKQAISQIEKNVTKKPEAATLEPLSRHLGINLQWLMTGKGSKQSSAKPATGETHLADQTLKAAHSASTLLAPDPVMLAAAYQWTLIGIALFGGPTLKLSLASDAKWVSEVYAIVVRGGGAPLGRESSPELEAVIRKRAQELGTPTHDRHLPKPARGQERRRL